MQLPFSIEQFFGVFRTYNMAVWPAQVFLFLLALTAIALVLVRRSWSGLAISAILAFLWMWLGLAYHLAFFSAINPVAYVFAGVSVAGGLVFFWQGVVRRRLDFQWTPGARSYTGLAFIVFALIVYPAWSVIVGHGYPALPTFGLPCPTTIFTIGLLAFMVTPYPRSPLGCLSYGVSLGDRRHFSWMCHLIRGSLPQGSWALSSSYGPRVPRRSTTNRAAQT